MRVCQKATAAGVAYGLRFTAYFPCIKGQGRFAVLDATAFQPGPTHEAAFGPTEVLSQPPNSTAGIGRGADVGISGRTRLFAKFTCVSSIQAMDIAVDPADPTIIWVVGPEDAASVNPACGKPYGGPLLKWDWASSSFKPTASAKGAGYRVTIMPGVKKPWIVDGCGQLSGWGQGWKRLYGPAPQGQLFDIAAVNGTVFSGCGSYNPSTFEGDIAAGCLLSAAVGPNRELHTSDAGDVAVMADGRELLANGQHVLYKDPALDQFFRAYRAPDGYHPVRIAAGSNGSVWLVVGPPTTPMLTTRAARLAVPPTGVH
ncbi:periplasmic substrate binding [Chlorella sorokiniana]|uniref:Periplasmic substrate binding n=1 Tax=Chlorella sorokiniana TaxID=3076 RepID=A0A2P6TVD3_CHLSO|nr:periplasmic substrate binding [Chlorella sorokiniana]|eukprot:PRW58021.1 periplasmic substrate binding [Chlorella sorokiniana]